MRNWNQIQNTEADLSALPETGSVFDNKDGSYAGTHRLLLCRAVWVHCVALCFLHGYRQSLAVWSGVGALCCIVLQCSAVCLSVLQHL